MEIYHNGELALDQLMAFAITEDMPGRKQPMSGCPIPERTLRTSS
jgi:hypothetical protein